MSHIDTIADTWIAAWNARDLDRILALYADDCEMTSAAIQRLGIDAGGLVHGKPALRRYWARALDLLPDLHFDLLHAFHSPNSVVVHYRNERGQEVCEYLRLDASGQIIAGAAHHL